MVKLGVVLMVVAGMSLGGVALGGCSTKDLPPAEQAGSPASAPASASASVPASVSVTASVSVSSAPPQAPSPSVGLSEAPLTAPPSTLPPAPPVPPLRPLPPATVTAGPIAAPGPVTAQETAFLAQLKALSAHVADGYTAIALGHKVCNQFGTQIAYNEIADGITGYDADDARNLITAAVLTLCPQYKSQVGG